MIFEAKIDLMNDTNIIKCTIIIFRRLKMKEIFEFFKEIFMISDNSSKYKIGLSQFKSEQEKPVAKTVKVQKDVKLSDLMRRSA